MLCFTPTYQWIDFSKGSQFEKLFENTWVILLEYIFYCLKSVKCFNVIALRCHQRKSRTNGNSKAQRLLSIASASVNATLIPVENFVTLLVSMTFPQFHTSSCFGQHYKKHVPNLFLNFIYFFVNGHGSKQRTFASKMPRYQAKQRQQ